MRIMENRKIIISLILMIILFLPVPLWSNGQAPEWFRVKIPATNGEKESPPGGDFFCRVIQLYCLHPVPEPGNWEKDETGNNKKAVPDMPDTLFWAPEIVVTAERINPFDRLTNRSGFVSLIDMEEQGNRVEDIADILSRTVGLKIRRYGGTGNFATASIRGSSSSQVSIYLNGIPLNDPYTGVANLSDLSASGISRIEIYRGSNPASLGSAAIGGVINLVTFRQWDDQQGDPLDIVGSASAGSFGTRRYSLKLFSDLRHIILEGNCNYMESEGDFSFHDDNATPENPYDDKETDRINNHFSRWNYAARLAGNPPGFGSVSLSHHGVLREGGVPGLGSNQSTTARMERKKRITILDVKPECLLSERIQAECRGFYVWTAERFEDPHGEIGLAHEITSNRITSYGVNTRIDLYPPWLPVSLTIFGEGRKERFHPVELFPRSSSGPDRLRETHTLSLTGDIVLLEERLVLTTSLTSQWYQNEFYTRPPIPALPPSPRGKFEDRHHSPHLGLRCRLAPFLTLKGNWGRYYRLPTFLELFGNIGSVTGNSELIPENSENRDIGLIFSTDKISFLQNPFAELAWLDNRIEDLILFFPNSQRTVKPQNIGAATVRGAEFSASFSLLDFITVSGNYSYLYTRNESPIPYYSGNQLPARPRHQGAFQLGIKRNRWSCLYQLHHIGSNYLDRANMNEVPGRKIHNLSLTLKDPDHGVSLTLEAQNLGDNRIADVSGFPLPGRSFYTTLELSR